MSKSESPFPFTEGEFSSDEWCTPADLAEDLGSFDLDPCSNSRSHIRSAVRWGLEFGVDGLKMPWGASPSYIPQGSVFCNPPYSDVLPWAERLTAHRGEWVALVKLDPTTRWWRAFFPLYDRPDWAPLAARVRFERPDKPPMTANFPSALIWKRRILGPAMERRLFR